LQAGRQFENDFFKEREKTFNIKNFPPEKLADGIWNRCHQRARQRPPNVSLKINFICLLPNFI